jgi:hypothetical protein
MAPADSGRGYRFTVVPQLLSDRHFRISAVFEFAFAFLLNSAQLFNAWAAPAMGDAIRDFVARQNIAHYQGQLRTEKEPAKRAILHKLLAEEEAAITTSVEHAMQRTVKLPTRH